MTLKGPLRYAAAMMRDAQDVYAKDETDISRRPEILATLYKLGKAERRTRQCCHKSGHECCDQSFHIRFRRIRHTSSPSEAL